MTFYLTIKTDRPLTLVPWIDAIDITLDGKEKQCSWDYTDASIEGCYIQYRFKGVAYYADDEEVYANGTIKKDSVITIDKDFYWTEDDEAEEFDFEIVSLDVYDYDLETYEEVELHLDWDEGRFV